MTTIPLSTDFAITPSTVAAAGAAVDANGLVLTDNELVPVGSVSYFYQDSDVSALMGSTSKEFLAAQRYFKGYDDSTVLPGTLLMARIVTTPVAGYLLSASLKGVSLATLQAIPAGTITLTVDGTATTSTSIDLSTATSFSDIASKLETGIGATKVDVVWNAIASRFIIRSATTGADSAVSFATAGALATGLLLTAATAATVSPGSDAVSMTDMMNGVVNTNQDWVAFASVVELTDNQKSELCAWANSTPSRYVYVVHDTSNAPTIANNSNCFVQQVVVANGYENIFPVYGSYLYAMTALAYGASLDFARTGGRVSFKFRSFSGLAPNVTDLNTAKALKSNGYNFYGNYGQNQTVAQYASDGAITGRFLWLDSLIGQVWLNAKLLAAFTAAFTANQSFPYNAEGYASIDAAVTDPANEGVNFGIIRKGVTLDSSQIRQVNNVVGKDISAPLFSDGWYLYIPTQSGANRQARKLAGVTFFYVDGQLIQSITMTSAAIL